MTEEEIQKENERYYKEGGKTPPLQNGQVSIDNLVGPGEVKALRKPERGSHKGQNGKVLIIGGSALFHAASLWALKAASRIVDMVFYSSVPENNELVKKAKEEFRDGIVVSRNEIDSYIGEADAILIGPGLERTDETKELTERLFKEYPLKRWVIDAGSLQMMDPVLIPPMAILTPHHKEFETIYLKSQISNLKSISQISNLEETVKAFAKKHNSIVVLKGERDIITDGEHLKFAVGGNPGMTKGGTGDVLAGVIAGFAAMNDPFLAARAGSFLNKLAGDMLYKKVNTMFNATDLVEMIPEAYKSALEY